MDAPLSVGDEVDGKYCIVRTIGSGGMGHVYEAMDRSLGRHVALKGLRRIDLDDAVARERLFREGRAAALVRHPNVIRIYEMGTDGRTDYVAMELLEGEDLHDRLQHDGSLPVALVEQLALQLADALEAIHARGIVHRDLKPRNLFLAREGSAQDVLKVLDFGVAKAAKGHVETLTETGQVFGTLHYMSPEQLRGARHADVRSDLWAAGAVLYELLCGHPPFEADSATELVLRVATDEPPPLETQRPDTTPALREAIHCCLQRDPALRPQSAAEFRALLLGARKPQRQDATPGKRAEVNSLMPVQTRDTFGSAPTMRPVVPRRTRLLATALGGAALVVLLLPDPGVLGLRPASQPLPPAPAGMVWIRGGSFSMGRTRAELDAECKRIGAACDLPRMLREVPRHVRDIAPFLLDANEVTNREVAETLDALGPSLYVVEDEDESIRRFVRWNKGLGHDDEYLFDLHPQNGALSFDGRHFVVRPGGADLPAVQMTWFGARMHCQRLGKRLPTEDEWEAAARGTDDRPYPWGSSPPVCGSVTIPSEPILPMVGTCRPLTGPTQVGSSAQDVTPEGVHDLAGNVAEWVDTAYVASSRRTRTGEGTTDLPRVIRGGSWGDPLLARTTGRTHRPPNSVGANVGFRCALSAASVE